MTGRHDTITDISPDKKKMKSRRVGPPPMDPKKSYINPGNEDQMEVQGYQVNKVVQVLTWTCIFLTLGLLRLIFHWKPEWMLQCTHSTCSLAAAERVLLKDMYGQMFVAKVIVSTKDGTRVKVLQAGDVFSYKMQHKDNRSELLFQDPRDEALMRYFNCKKLKYIWDPCQQEFSKVRGLEDGISCSYFYQCRGLGLLEQCRQRIIYGTNRITVHVTPILVLLFKEGLNPFYVFQVFSCCLWFADEYYYYASAIVLISILSLATTIYQTRKMQRALRNTVSSSTVVTLCRGDEVYEDISSEDLVPGDVIEIPRSGCMMQCDAVLLSGNVIVNESMLTGESVPVTKTPLPNPKAVKGQDLKFNIKEHSRHTLFCGTLVIQTRFYGSQKVRAVVIRTGFSTAKGELVRSILFPKPVDFKFNRDTYYFIGVLALVSMIGFIYTVILMVERGDGAGHIIQRALDLITIAVPPALPAAMTVGIVFAQSRLKKSAIYCISPRSINVCGSINVVCFDKTGTLTEDGLDFQSVVPASNGIFGNGHASCKKLDSLPLLVSMATCHSLTIIDGVLSGDPLDLIMFEATDWELEEPGEEESRFDMMAPTVVKPKTPLHYIDDTDTGVQVGVLRQFTFSSSLQRMSVITRTLGASNFDIYAKGAPEMIASLCNPETVPSNFHEVLMGYTQHGYRVLALAWKALPSKLNYVKVSRVEREQVEKNLKFLGLLVMENRLKPETTPVIHQLREADIRTIMVTGDNMLTALSVARECGMIDRTDRVVLVNAGVTAPQDEPVLEFVYTDDKEKEVEEVTTYNEKHRTTIRIDEDNPRFHFAVTGKSWACIKLYFPDILPKIVVRGAVFARMSPDQKGQLVEVLQDLGYYVGMCGDGANDCGALKMAHAGISLSEAEASVASPFTSKNPNITCVPTVIREGRCALVTSFGIFKYMACYSLTQFVTVCMLYWISNNLTDFEFLYIDLFLITTLSITFGRTGPYKELVKEVPPVSLLSVQPIMSLIVHAGIHAGAQTWVYFYIQDQPWFTPFEKNDDLDYVSYENTAIYLVSSFQYITLAIIFSKGAPYRKTIFTNYFYLGNLVVCIGVSALSVIYPPAFLEELLELRPPPSMIFRLLLLGISSLNFLVCIIAESFLIDNYLIRKKCRDITERCLPSMKYQYATVEQEIAEMPDWPPVCGSLSSKQIDTFSSVMVADGAPTNHMMSWGGDEGSLDGSYDGASVNMEKDRVSSAMSSPQCGFGQLDDLTEHPQNLMSASDTAVLANPVLEAAPRLSVSGSGDATADQIRGVDSYRPDSTGPIAHVELTGDARDDSYVRTDNSTTTNL